jgi:hypothetical protein
MLLGSVFQFGKKQLSPLGVNRSSFYEPIPMLSDLHRRSFKSFSTRPAVPTLLKMEAGTKSTDSFQLAGDQTRDCLIGKMLEPV